MSETNEMNEANEAPATPPAPVVLRYVGNAEGHGYFVQGVPVCDLTQEMIDASGYSIDDLLAFSGPAFALVSEGE